MNGRTKLFIATLVLATSVMYFFHAQEESALEAQVEQLKTELLHKNQIVEAFKIQEKAWLQTAGFESELNQALRYLLKSTGVINAFGMQLFPKRDKKSRSYTSGYFNEEWLANIGQEHAMSIKPWFTVYQNMLVMEHGKQRVEISTDQPDAVLKTKIRALEDIRFPKNGKMSPGFKQVLYIEALKQQKYWLEQYIKCHKLLRGEPDYYEQLGYRANRGGKFAYTLAEHQYAHLIQLADEALKQLKQWQ